MDFTRINNDVNGNPRYVFHFLQIASLNKAIERKSDWYRVIYNSYNGITNMYNTTLEICKKAGGKKYHNKQFGGGIVFQSYSTDHTIKDITEVVQSAKIELKIDKQTFFVSPDDMILINKKTGKKIKEIEKNKFVVLDAEGYDLFGVWLGIEAAIYYASQK